MEHGIGLKNAEAVLEKYDGRIAFDCDEKEFRVTMQIRSIRKQYYRNHFIAFTRASAVDKSNIVPFLM